MTQILVATLGGLLILLGFVGCIVPALPGPLLAYASLWVLVAFGASPGVGRLAAGGAIVVAAMVIDYVLPSLVAKRFKCSGLGVFGCFAGTVVGLFFMPLGLVLGPFLGTVAGELIAGREMGASLKGGVGALIGFVMCLMVKLGSVGLLAVWFFGAL